MGLVYGNSEEQTQLDRRISTDPTARDLCGREGTPHICGREDPPEGGKRGTERGRARKPPAIGNNADLREDADREDDHPRGGE